MSVLEIRLKNCLQTIIDTQSTISRRHSAIFSEDFSCLQRWLQRLDMMELTENDVARMEDITTQLLREFRFLACPGPAHVGRAH